MKSILSCILLSCLSSISAFASDSIGGDVLADPSVKAIYSLLNAANANSCVTPTVSDVSTGCLGRLHQVSEPTIEIVSCDFTLKITCSDGASALIYGSKPQYEIVDQNQHVTSPTDGGIKIEGVDLTPVHAQ